MMPLWKRVVHFFVLAILLLNITAPIEAVAGDCVRTGSVCTQGPETRDFNGIKIYKDCWAWNDTYKCTATGGTKSCDPLVKTTGCGQTTSTCTQYSAVNPGLCIQYAKNYTCGTDVKKAYGGVLPSGITELPATHEISSTFDETVCNANASQFTGCSVTATTCTKGVATKVINGVTVSFPCWENEHAYQCLEKTTTSTCDTTELNSKCTLSKTNCLNTVNGVCQTGENIYKCMTRAGSSAPSDSCKDKDFGQVMSGIEGAREFSKYFDPNTLQFFKGDDSRCSVKLDGALGGDCCKTKTDHNAWRDAAINYAASYALKELASSYTYTVLTSAASSTIAGMAGGSAVAGSVGTYGVGASVSATGEVALTFNPVFFAAAVVMYFFMEWLGCDQEDRKTSLKIKAGLCHSVGSYCDSKVLGMCVEKKQSYCCFVSKLAKIINEQGKTQLALGYGTPKVPVCNGFDSAQLGKIDFGKMDFTEFINDIKFTAPDVPGISNKAGSTATNQVNQLNLKSIINPQTQGTYYGTP